MKRTRIVEASRPDEIGRRDGLAYTLWLPPKPDPERPPRGVVVLHGADSRKESHHDFARALLPAGFGAVVFDQRGHGDSGGAMGAGALEDVATMAGVLREGLGDPSALLALRGSSMGGFIALLAGPLVAAAAVVAICPASAEGLARGLRSGHFAFAADAGAVTELLDALDLTGAVAELEIPVLLLHAEGDERVPIEHSRMLAGRLGHEASRLIEIPGGHHRSIQHDGELQAVSLRFLDRHLR